MPLPGLSHWDLMSIEKPARYIGGEVHESQPKPDARLRVCLLFPDMYELGMSNIALKILYELLDRDPEIAVERCFTPWIDLERILRGKHLPLFSLESKTPLHEFDVLGCTLPYELTFTNVLNMLDLGGVPLHAADRRSGPLVIGGGPSTTNPLPMADFFDAFLIGDGEEAFPELCRLLIDAAQQGLSREAQLEKISAVPGYWVPSFPKPVRRRVLTSFSSTPPPLRPIVPHIQAIHNRVPLEIFRGCVQGCRFCNAGYFYRPKRERPASCLQEWADTLLRQTGEDTLGLVSLSTSDYSDLHPLLENLHNARVFPEQTFSVPSLRMDDRTLALLEKTPHIAKGGLTFAPEAGTQRLRDIINKHITEEDILRVISETSGSTYRNVKLYFMIGLPFERDEDIDGIVDLVRKIESVAARRKPRKTLSLSLSGFVPKAFTPFQWAPQLPPAELHRRCVRVCDGLKRSSAKISWRDEFICQLECVLARGDRRVGQVIEAAFRRGCRMDGWGELFQESLWRQAFEDAGLHPEEFTREFPLQDELPWDFIDLHVPKAFLEKEFQAAAALAGGG